MCARYQSCPKISHLLSAKRIIKYINDTSDYGLLYTFDIGNSLISYCDANWVGSSKDKKSTFGGCFFLRNNLISWFNKKQNCVFLSTPEVEYIAARSSSMQLMWMKQMLQEYDIPQDVNTLYCDNMSSINISKTLSNIVVLNILTFNAILFEIWLKGNKLF